jgi:hypothetical protein
MSRRYSRARSLRLPPVLLGVLLLTLVLAPAALATVVTGPITWLPADSTYGVAETPFVTVPMAPPGTGATALAPGAAFGAGFWDDGSEVYVMGFLNQMPLSVSMPGLAETELGVTPLYYGVPLGSGTPSPPLRRTAADRRNDTESAARWGCFFRLRRCSIP